MLSGAWDDNTSWEFVRASEVPDTALCTAVYCLALHHGKVVLAHNHRGWEMLGGHIESGETLEESVLRECLEEGGFVPEHLQMFGYRKLTSKRPVPHSQRKGYYPFPNAYIPHFVAAGSLLRAPNGNEIIESRAFALDELAALQTEHLPVIHAGLAAYEALGLMRATGNSAQSLT